MRVTISKTIDLADIPAEIDEVYISIEERLLQAKQVLDTAIASAREGRYINSAEELDTFRQGLVIIDKNLEEQQSLLLSYEKIRIQSQMPDQTQSAPPQMETSEDV